MMIDAGQIQDLLQAALPDCEISVNGEGGKFQGAIHAVSMRLMTVQEKAALA